MGGGGRGSPPPPGNAQGRGSLAGATASVKTNYVALCCPWLAVVFLGGCCCFVVVENLWWKNKPIIRRLGWLVLAPWAKWRKMGGKAKVVPQACGQPQACRWGVRGALPIGEKLFWRALQGIFFTALFFRREPFCRQIIHNGPCQNYLDIGAGAPTPL